MISKNDNNIIAALDVGTSKIVTLVAEMSEDHSIDIIGYGICESKGLKRGIVVDIEATVESVLPGPVVTRFEIQPAPGTKASKITNIAQDIARSLSVSSVRVVEVIEGKSFVGIEIPNNNRKMVRLTEILSSKAFKSSPSNLSVALGQDISGNPIVVDLSKMPHMLVAGTTGSGKSVGLNAMLLSLLFKSDPEDVRLILVDPKM